MGHKAHPIGLRLGIHRKWKSNWFFESKNYTKFLHLNLNIEKFFQGFFYFFKINKSLVLKTQLIKLANNELFIIIYYYRFRKKIEKTLKLKKKKKVLFFWKKILEVYFKKKNMKKNIFKQQFEKKNALYFLNNFKKINIKNNNKIIILKKNLKKKKSTYCLKKIIQFKKILWLFFIFNIYFFQNLKYKWFLKFKYFLKKNTQILLKKYNSFFRQYILKNLKKLWKIKKFKLKKKIYIYFFNLNKIHTYFNKKKTLIKKHLNFAKTKHYRIIVGNQHKIWNFEKNKFKKPFYRTIIILKNKKTKTVSIYLRKVDWKIEKNIFLKKYNNNFNQVKFILKKLHKRFNKLLFSLLLKKKLEKKPILLKSKKILIKNPILKIKKFLTKITNLKINLIFINALSFAKFFYFFNSNLKEKNKKKEKFNVFKIQQFMVNRYKYDAIFIKDFVYLAFLSVFFKNPVYLVSFIGEQFKRLPKNRKQFKLLKFITQTLKIFCQQRTEIVGFKLQIKGRLNRRNRKHKWVFSRGILPLQTYSTRVEYGYSKGFTRRGIIGIKVWYLYNKQFKNIFKLKILQYLHYSKYKKTLFKFIFKKSSNVTLYSKNLIIKNLLQNITLKKKNFLNKKINNFEENCDFFSQIEFQHLIYPSLNNAQNNFKLYKKKYINNNFSQEHSKKFNKIKSKRNSKNILSKFSNHKQ